MKRNIINEIKSVKERTEFNSRHDFTYRLDKIESPFKVNLDYNGDFDEELLKYIPIATVACFEAFFRSAIKELVDFGKPYSDNVVNFNQAKNVKFDFDIVNAIQAKTVTVGEFISHILPCNNFDDINSNLSTLASIDFANSIKSFQRESIFDHVTENSKKFIDDYDCIIADIKRTFELRHIFCHEFATNLKVDKDEIFKCFYSAKIFLNQTNDFIWYLLYPNAPETQTEMNIQASKDFEKVDEELNNLIVDIKEAVKEHSYMPLNMELFDTTIDEWKKYSDAQARLSASSVEGGSMYPLIYAVSLTTTTKEKIESLKNEFAVDLRRFAMSK